MRIGRRNRGSTRNARERGDARKYRAHGLVVFLRKDLGVTLNGSDVATWVEQSGRGNSVTQAAPAKQPLYSATNGIVCTKANGDELVRASTNLLGSGAYTIINAVKFATLATLDIWLTCGGAGAGMCLSISAGSLAVTHLGIASEVGGAAQTTAIIALTVRRDAGAVPTMRVNGAAQTLSPGTTNTMGDPGPTAQLAVGSLGGSNFADCSHHEIYIFTSSVPASVALRIEHGIGARCRIAA